MTNRMGPSGPPRRTGAARRRVAGFPAQRRAAAGPDPAAESGDAHTKPWYWTTAAKIGWLATAAAVSTLVTGLVTGWFFANPATAAHPRPTTETQLPPAALAPLPADNGRWMPTGTDAHAAGCMNRTPGTQEAATQPVMFLGKHVGTLYLYENPAPTCGLVWAEFWTGTFALDFQSAGIGHVRIVLNRLGTSQTEDQVADWDESDLSQLNDSDEWTDADKIASNAQYQAALDLTGS